MPRGDGLRKLSTEQRDKIAKIYTTQNADGTWTGVTTIARQFNVSKTLVQYVLNSRNIPTRSAKEAHAHGKQCRPVINIPPEGETEPLCACGCGQQVKWSQHENKWLKYIKGHYRKEKPYYDRDWLHREYVINKRTIGSIADECGVRISTVTKFMKKHGVRARKQSESLRLSGGVSKERNPAWQGGVTPERQRLYKTKEWKDLIKAVYKRDNYHCQRCNTPKIKAVKLHAHHIKSWAEYPDLRQELSNLITLCDTCHTWVHSLENTNLEFIG